MSYNITIIYIYIYIYTHVKLLHNYNYKYNMTQFGNIPNMVLYKYTLVLSYTL